MFARPFGYVSEVLRAVLVGEELHVVDQQQIERVVACLEIVERAPLVGLDHIRDELLRVDVENFRVRLVLQELVAHRVHQVGLAQAHAAVDEKRVVEVPRRARHVHRGRACHAVGRALHQRLERQGRVEPRAERAGLRLVARHGRGGLVGRRLGLGCHGAHISPDNRFSLSER
jgi:hypothetical protein